MNRVLDYIDIHWQEALADVMRLCRQPSISAQGVGLDETAELLAQMMAEYGIPAQILLYAGGDFLKVCGIPATQGHIRSGLGQGSGGYFSQATGGTCHHGHLSTQIK